MDDVSEQNKRQNIVSMRMSQRCQASVSMQPSLVPNRLSGWISLEICVRHLGMSVYRFAGFTLFGQTGWPTWLQNQVFTEVQEAQRFLLCMELMIRRAQEE